MNTHTSPDTPFIPAPRITTVAGYLLTRLAEVGLASVFGVPGDYNLGLLDAIADRPDLAWIGMATEQGAGYAADSYARLRGIGALVTTFGVGELSALNAIAGAYAESVPVVHIVGTPALAARETGATLHHNLPGHDYGHFARMAAEVTAAQADLRPDTATEEIAVLPEAKGDFPESDPCFAGLYAGLASAKRARVAVEDADVLITVGVTLADTVAPASSPVALRVATSHELAWALNAAHYHAGAGRPVLIEAVLGAEDAPPLLQDLARALAASHQ